METEIKSIWIRGLGGYYVTKEKKATEISSVYVKKIVERDSPKLAWRITTHNGEKLIISGNTFVVKYGTK